MVMHFRIENCSLGGEKLSSFHVKMKLCRELSGAVSLAQQAEKHSRAWDGTEFSALVLRACLECGVLCALGG